MHKEEGYSWSFTLHLLLLALPLAYATLASATFHVALEHFLGLVYSELRLQDEVELRPKLRILVGLIFQLCLNLLYFPIYLALLLL